MIRVKKRKRIPLEKIVPTVLDKLEKKLDKTWSYAIKERADWKCQMCDRYSRWLESHHIISRKCKSTRWDLDNGLCLCMDCHKYEQVKNTYKDKYPDKYEGLLERGNLTAHFTEEDLIKKLAELTK